MAAAIAANFSPYSGIHDYCFVWLDMIYTSKLKYAPLKCYDFQMQVAPDSGTQMKSSAFH
eukprot:scaffold272027_cov21-Tisochrysis_lutea.AAC.1